MIHKHCVHHLQIGSKDGTCGSGGTEFYCFHLEQGDKDCLVRGKLNAAKRNYYKMEIKFVINCGLRKHANRVLLERLLKRIERDGWIRNITERQYHFPI